MNSRCLMIGLDGADPRLLFRAMDTGELPQLAKLAARGHRQLLQNAGEYSDDSAWASFCFGKPPSQHGRHHYQMPASDGKLGMAFTRESARETFWWKMSKAGAKVAIVDIPKCPTPVPLNGIQLADWLVHGKYHHKPVSYPPELADQIIDIHGTSPPSKCDYMQQVRSDAELLEFHQHLQSSVQQKRAAALDLIKRRQWDLFAVAFKEAHCAGHHLWHLRNRHRMKSSQPGTSHLADMLMSVYQSLDNAVGELVAAAGPSTNALVFTNSSMTINGSLKHLERQLEIQITSALIRRFGGVLSKFCHIAGVTSPRRCPTRCVLLPCNDNLLAFKVFAERERIHEDGVEFVEQLLRGLVDPLTGWSPFTMLSRPQANENRPWADLVLHCIPGSSPTTITSPVLGTISAPLGAIRTGNHVGGGAYIASGALSAKHARNIRFIHELAEVAETVVEQSKSAKKTENGSLDHAAGISA